jgi:small subunit ribosomal protein S20
MRQNAERRLKNKAQHSEMKTIIKKVLAAVEAGDKAAAATAFVLATKKIDKAAKTRVIHPNAAARYKSNLARRVAKLS